MKLKLFRYLSFLVGILAIGILVFMSRFSLHWLGSDSKHIRNTSYFILNDVLDWNYQYTIGNVSIFDHLHILYDEKIDNRINSKFILKATCGYSKNHSFDPRRALLIAITSGHKEFIALILHRKTDLNGLNSYSITDLFDDEFLTTRYQTFGDLVEKMLLQNKLDDATTDAIKKSLASGEIPDNIPDPCQN